jgi:putative component of toxin-antitoxin plasmid stabilization module
MSHDSPGTDAPKRTSENLPTADRKITIDGGVSSGIHLAPSWRSAKPKFLQRDRMLILLLVGGDKSTQSADIRLAQRLAQNL